VPVEPTGGVGSTIFSGGTAAKMAEKPPKCAIKTPTAAKITA